MPLNQWQLLKERMLHSDKSNSFKAARFLAVAVAALVCQAGLAVAVSVQPSPDKTTGTAPSLVLAGKTAGATHSSGIEEILKMLDAQLDSQVILAYIQKSAIPYNPDASELITLKEHGASSELLVALLHRGQELNARIAQARIQPAPSPQTAPAPANTAVPVAPEYAPVQTAPVYPDYYPAYSYGYPVAYGTYGYWWPYSCGYYYNGCWHNCYGYGHGYYGYGRAACGFGHGANCGSFSHPVCRTWTQSFHFNSAAGHPVSISASGHSVASFGHSGGGVHMAMHSGGGGGHR